MTRRRAVLWMHDIAGEQVDAIGHGILELYTDKRLDQSERLVFELPTDHPKIDRIVADTDVVFEGERFHIVEPETNRDGSATTIRVEADASWYRLGEISWIGSIVLEDLTPAEGIAAILDGTRWEVDATKVTSTDTYSMEAQDRSRLELLRTWAKIVGAHLRFETVSRLVYFADEAGVDSGLSFRFARNIKGLRKRERAPEVTVLYPFGADDLTIAGVNGGAPYVEDFSYYTDQGIDEDTARELYTKSVPWADSSFLRDVDLLAAAEARLARLSVPAYTYELDVVDLSEITTVKEQARLGDTVRVYDPDLGDDVRPIVTRVERHPLEPWRNVIELGTFANPLGDGSTSTRGASVDQWILFTGPVSANFAIRNDASWTVARIPLRFREGGQAHYHLDLWMTGVGAGTATVTVYEAEADETIREVLSVDYTDGVRSRVHLTWAATELEGSKDYRIRVTTEADGGPSETNGVDLDLEGDGSASFYILAQGAVQETPTLANSVTYNFTGAVQEFVVPDNVETITITATGGAGGANVASNGGGGTLVEATFDVIPGDVFDVNVGGLGAYGSGAYNGTWPNGGYSRDLNTVGQSGGAGGGSSDVRPTGAGMADALVVAPGGGGGAVPLSPKSDTKAGDSGFFFGIGGHGNENQPPDGTVSGAGGGSGATQYGCAAGTPTTYVVASGPAGTFGQGASSSDGGNNFGRPGGGGGGGWYGGGAGVGGNLTGPGFGDGYTGGDGGGGSGMIRSDGRDLRTEDASNSGEGVVVISWETPLFPG